MPFFPLPQTFLFRSRLSVNARIAPPFPAQWPLSSKREKRKRSSQVRTAEQVLTATRRFKPRAILTATTVTTTAARVISHSMQPLFFPLLERSSGPACSRVSACLGEIIIVTVVVIILTLSFIASFPLQPDVSATALVCLQFGYKQPHCYC